MVWKAIVAALVAASSQGSNDAIFAAILANGQTESRDRFAERPKIERFPSLTIVAPIVDGQTNEQRAGGAGFYTYEGGVLTLVYSPSTESDILEVRHMEPFTRWLEATAYSQITPAGKFKASNSFGAQTIVTKYNLRTVKIAYDPSPNLALPELRIELPGSDARALSAVAAVRFTLETGAINGRPKCEHSLSSGTVARPISVDDLTCVVRAKLAKIEFIRRDTGEVLR